MTDWSAKAQAAIDHIRARKRVFSEDSQLGLIDFLAGKGTASAAEMQEHGSADFIGTALGHVTTAVHGSGSVPDSGGWYSHPAGKTYVIDPEFAQAWIVARAKG